jgi:diacylglycerol O-acyltransferase / wax synthase
MRSRTGPVDRATPADLAFLAMDRGGASHHVAVLIVLEPGRAPDLAEVTRLVGQRVTGVPRLRQRLVRVPPGCGRPAWVDDAAFDVRRHVSRIDLRPPGDERALLDAAVALAGRPLPRDRPLWSLTLVQGLAGGNVALLVVLHHVVADGVGGLAVLADLCDAAGPVAAAPPRPRPSLAALARDALAGKVDAARDAPRAWRDLRAAMSAAGGVRPPAVQPCSLNRPTGPARRLVAVRCDLGALRAAAHRRGGTVNDAVLAAVAGALHRLLRQRGERVDDVVVAVPVAGRRSTTAARLGNQVSPMLVTVPATGGAGRRIAAVAADVRVRKALATGPAPIALLGPAFRAAARLGGYRWYMNHQRRLHTLVSHVRGPTGPVRFAGARVTGTVPIALGDAGNITVAFEVLSYAGTLTICAVVDPDRFTDLDALTAALTDELAEIAADLGPNASAGRDVGPGPPGGARTTVEA